MNNKEAARSVAARKASNAAGSHADRRTRRVRTRAAQLRRAMKEA